MPLAIGDVVELRVQGDLFDQLIISRFHYQVLDPGTSPDTLTACTDIAGNWKAGVVSPFLAFLACCPPQYDAEFVFCQRISPVRNIPGFNAVGLPGTDANASTSSNQSATITKRCLLAGRAFVGSLHIPGLSQANMLNGKVTAAFLTKMSTVASRMLNDFVDPTNGTYLRPVLYHYRKVPFLPVPPTNLYAAIPQSTARVMRRRTVGVGK